MRRLVAVAAIMALFVLQLALADWQLNQSAPNLLLAYLCVALLFRPLQEVLAYALLAGVLMDLFSGLPDGVLTASLAAGLSSSYYFSQIFSTEKLSNFLLVFYVLLATAFFSAIMIVLTYALSWVGVGAPVPILPYKLVTDAILNLIAAFPVYLFVLQQEKIERKFSAKHEPV